MNECWKQVDRLRRQAGHVLSAHGFPSIWIWKEALGLELVVEEDYFTVRAGKNVWFFPCGNEKGKRAFLAGHAGEPDLKLRYLSDADAAWLQAQYPGQWKLVRRPDDDEYLYLRESHIAMEGSRFSHLRWRVHKIQRDLAPRTQILDQSNAADARHILDAWVSGRSAWDGDDREVALRALEMQSALGMHGVIVYLAGQPAGFMLGFPLAADTFDAAVGKCAADVQGLTYYVLRELMLSLPEQYRWMNLEEDLGLPGLRDMKEHFLPDGRHQIWEAQRL